MAISDDSESVHCVQITKCSLDDLLMSLKANKMALNSAVYMEDVDGKCSLREVFPIKDKQDERIYAT